MAAYRNTAANTVGIHKFYPAKTQEGRLKKAANLRKHKSAASFAPRAKNAGWF